MRYLACYETTDGNGEVEKEFATEQEVREHMAEIEHCLCWSTVYDLESDEELDI